MRRSLLTFCLSIGFILIGLSNSNPSIFYFDLCMDHSDKVERIAYDKSNDRLIGPLLLESNNCSAAVPLATDGTVTDVGTNIGSDDEVGEIEPTGLTSPISSVWYEITTTAPNTSIVIELNLGTMVDPAIAIWENTCFSALPAFVDFDASAGGVLPTQCLPPGTYLLQLATDAGNEGTYDINILANTSASPLNEDCTGAFNNPVVTGINTVDNNCSTDGLVWFEYTVVTGDHITVTPTGGFSVTQILLADCVTPVTSTTCLKPFDVIHIEAGDATPAFGTFDLDIVESDNIVVNDDCIDADASSLGTLNCTNTFNGSGDDTACDDTEATCNPGVQGVWYHFDVDAQVTAFDITGTSFEVFTGACGVTLTSLGCDGDLALTGIDITATGLDYYVLVYDDGTTSGSFTAVANPQTPSNDLCTGSPDDLSGETPVIGSTACASSPPTAFCNVTGTTDHAVWYEFTTPNNDLTTNITFTYAGSGANPAADLGIAIYDGCGGALLLTDCTGSGVLNCAYPNTTYIIAVGSSDGNEGEFTITGDEDNAGLFSNDLCVSPFDVTPGVDCEWSGNSGDLSTACVEQFNGACNQLNTPTVWQSITIPGNAIGLDFRNFVGSPSIQIYNNDCSDPTIGPSAVSGCISADGFQPLAPGTYLMSISSVGVFDFQFRTKVPPINDLCTSAEALAFGPSIPGTTACATFITEDEASCDGAPENLVWYTYDVTADTKTLTLNITNFSTGTINVAAWDGCTSGNYYNNDASNEECGTSISLDIDCPIAGTTIYFAVSSTQMEEGTFDIEIVESQVIVPANDDCANATLANGPNCEIYQTPTGDNEFACPETFSSGGCGFDTEEVVWYEIQLPADAVTIDIGINNYAGAGTGFFGVFTDCAGTLIDGTCHFDISNGDPVTDGVNIDVTGVAGSSIFVGFGSQGDTGGTHSFDVQINNTPTNDDPCTSDVIPSGGGTIAGTNECTTMDYDDPACSPQYENSVWYEYTLGAGETGVQVEIIANTATGPFGVSIVDQAGNCNGPATVFTNASSCVGETEIVQAACLPAGQIIHIVVATADGDDGTFDITLTPIVPMANCIDNDDCANAQDLGPLVTDAPCIILSDCNAGACPDIVGNCNGGLEVNNVVWYTVQNDGTGDFISVEITNATFNTPIVAVFVAPDCGSLTQIGPCSLGGAGGTATGPIDIDPANTPIAGENYYIAVGSDGVIGGDFDLCIEIIGGCVNDEPCDAVELMDGLLVNSPASTTNCTADEVNTSCPGADLNTVWYKFTMPAGSSSVNIEVNNISITGDYGMTIGEYVTGTPACQTQNPPFFEDCYSSIRFIEDIYCLKENTEYYIQIGSSDGIDAGDFDIEINFGPGLVDNDLCQEAVDDANFHIDITVDDYCKFTGLVGTTVDACPDQIMSGACDYTMTPTVWFQVNIPNDPAITLMDALLTDIGQSAGQFTIFEGPCTALTPLAGGECGNAGTIVANLTITPGASYMVAVTTSNDMPGDFEFEVKVLAPPANDLCENADQLSVGSSETGTTECATFSMDYVFDGCAMTSNESDVWYEITLTGDETVITVDITGFTGSGNYGAAAYFTNSDCAALMAVVVEGAVVEDCAGDKSLEIPVKCIVPFPTSIYIKVGSPSDDNDPSNGPEQGEFTISISNVSPSCTYADECDEIGEIMTPVTDPDGVIIYTACQAACLEYACPQTDVTDCNFGINPTVWVQVDTDAEAQQLYASVTTAGSWTPVFAIYMGDCNNLTLVPGGTVMDPINCNTDDTTPEVSNIGIQTDAMGNPISTYYIAISAEGIVDDPSFEICTATTIGTVACLGGIAPDYLNFTCDPQATFTVTGRSNDPDGSLGLPLDGPFCPGEVLDLNFAFFYDATATGNDWLQGIIPKFGEAIDVSLFDPLAITVTPGGSQWFPEGVPITNENIPQLCTYVDGNGVLQLCNPNCEICPAGCVAPLAAGSPLPGGWFWVTAGGGGCANDGTPSTMYGIPGGTQVNVEFDLQLTVKDFADMAECLENADKLTFSLQTFSDGVTGCWEDPTAECLKDINQVISYPIECNLPPGVIANPNPVELCNEGILNVTVQTEDGSNLEIIVTVEDNPNVEGENDYNFMGSGVITDELTNTSGSVQVVLYIMQAIDPNIFCPGPKDTLIVTIYPELEIEFSDVYVCDGLCTDLTPDLISGGTGIYTEYEWSTGEIGVTTINVCPTVPTTYTLTVTDDLGCTGIGEVEVDVKPKVDAEFIPNAQVYCIDGILGNDPPIIVTINDGSSPYNFAWESDPFGLDGTVTPGGTNFDGDTYQVEAENSNPSFVGPYEVCVEVYDLFGCADTTCMEVTVLLAPLATFTLETPLACGQTEVNLVADYDEANSFTGFDHFELFDCEGNFLESGGTDPYTFTGYDLENNDCFILYSYNVEGCADIDDIQLTITQGEPAVLAGDSTICSGSVANIEVVNSSSYLFWNWSNLENTSSISVSPDSTTTYLVTVTEASGCTDVASFEVIVNEAPVIEIAGSTSYCANSSTTLMATAAAGSTYLWTDAANTPVSMTSEITISTPGNYTVMVTLNGCVSDSTIFVSEESTLNVNLNNPPLCDNGVDTLFAGNGFATYAWSFNDTPIAGADTSFLEVSTEGTYAVTITDGGCTGADTVNVINSPTPSAIVTDTIEVCRQMDAGNVVINFNNQVTGSTGTWSDSDLTGVDLINLDSVSFEGIARDTYSFTYTTNTAIGNCENVSYIMEVIVISCPCPVVATRAIPDQCNNSGNIVPLNTYLTSPMVQVGFWSFVSGPQALVITNDSLDLSGVVAGAYIVQWNLGTPIGTCPDSSLQTINVFEAPYVEVDPSPKVLCNLDSGQGAFEVDLNTYLLAGSATGNWTQTSGPTVDLVNLPTVSGEGLTAGDVIQFTYTTNSATAPCIDETAVVDILIRDCSCPFVVIENLPIACNSGTSFNLDLYVATDPVGLNGSWSIDYTPSPLTGSVFDATGVPSGLYTVTFTLDNDPGAGCQREFTQQLFVRRQPTAEVIGSGSPCNTNSTGLDITTVDLFTLLAPNPSSGTWSQTGGTPTLTIDPSGIVDFDGLNIGDVFEFTYMTDSAIDPCVDVTAVVSVTVIDCNCPNLDINPVGPLCNTDTEIDLAGLEGPTIGIGSWSVNGPSGNVTLNGTILTITDLPGGDYDLTYTLSTMPAGSCMPDTTTVLTIIDQISATVLPDAQACSEDDGQNGNVIDLFANVTDGDMTGKWYFPDGTEITIPNFADFQLYDIGDVITVTYVITALPPCMDQTYQVDVEIIDCNCTQIITTDFEACSTEGQIDLTPYGDQNLAGSFQSTDVTITGTTVDASDLNGNFMIDYVLDSPEPNCPDRETFIMTIIKQFNPGVAVDTALCVDVNDVIDLFSLIEGEDTGGVWTETSSQPSTSGFDPSNGTFDTDGQAVGSFRFTYSFSNNSPCPDVSSEVTVTIQNKPPVDAGVAQILDCILLTAQLGGTPGNAAFDYEWTHSGGLDVPNSTDAQTSVDFPGVFTLTVTDKVTGCMATDQVTIDLSNARPEAGVAFEDISCFGEGDGVINVINIMGGLPPYQYSSNGGTTFQNSANFLNLEQGSYDMVISDAAGCVIDLGTVEIAEPMLLSVELGDIQTVKLEETVSLSIEGQFFITPITSIVWTITTESGDSIICDGLDCITYDYFATESATICVTIIDNNGCQADDCIIINVIKVRDITLPEIFTPKNGDDINSIFFVNDNDVETVDKFYIFDRWGNKVFSVEGVPPNDPQFGWNGTFNGEDVEQGVYVFVIELTYVGGLNETDTFSGDVTVLR